MVQICQNRTQDAADHAHAHFIGLALKFPEDLVQGIDEIGGVEEMVLDHVLGVLGFVEDGGEVGFCGHFEDVATIDVEVVLTDLLANEPPIYYRSYVPEKISLLFLLEGNGELLVELLLVVAPRDHCALLAFEVVEQAHAGAQEDAFCLLEDFDVVYAFVVKLVGGDLQVSVAHQFILAGHFVGDGVDLHCGLEVLQREIALRVHYLSLNMFITSPI